MTRNARKVWTESEVSLLKIHYSNMRTEELAKLIGCTLNCVYHKAFQIGLRKSPVFMASCASGRLMPGGEVGKHTRFKPGQPSHNKGKKFPARGRAIDTQFKPGSTPPNILPIGSERFSKDGYLQRKITETGYRPRDWVAVHDLIWIAQHGPIPEGHVVVFRNKKRTDIRLDNLEMISRAELMQRNSIHRYPEPVKEVIRLSGKLNRTIRRLCEKQG